VLGSSLGRTSVQVEIDAGKVPALALPPQGAVSPLATAARLDVQKLPIVDKPPIEDAKAVRDHSWPSAEATDPNPDHGYGTGAYDTSPLFEKTPIQDAFPFPPTQAGAIAPFALATAHQAPADVISALQGRGGPFAPAAVSPMLPRSGVLDRPVTVGDLDLVQTGFFLDGIYYTGLADIQY
jgi:hypothetical protein